MAKNKPAFPSSHDKAGNDQGSKGENKTPIPIPKKTIRGNSRGQ